MKREVVFTLSRSGRDLLTGTGKPHEMGHRFSSGKTCSMHKIYMETAFSTWSSKCPDYIAEGERAETGKDSMGRTGTGH